MSEQNNSSRLRKSTVESSRQLEIFLQERKIKSQNRKVNKKSAKATETEVVTTYSKEINEVVDLADNSENSVETEQNIEIEDPSVDPLAGLTPGSSRRLRSVSTEEIGSNVVTLALFHLTELVSSHILKVMCMN